MPHTRRKCLASSHALTHLLLFPRSPHCSTPLWTWWGGNRSVNGTASVPPEGAVEYQTEDVCGKRVAHRAKTARFSAAGNSEVWWVWCAWWNTKTRGWHTEGCTIVDLSMTSGATEGNSGGGGSSSAPRNAVVRCECLMPGSSSDTTVSFQGSFGIIKENNEENQAKRVKDKQGDAGSLLGYIFKRIASSFNVVNIPYDDCD